MFWWFFNAGGSLLTEMRLLLMQGTAFINASSILYQYCFDVSGVLLHGYINAGGGCPTSDCVNVGDVWL